MITGLVALLVLLSLVLVVTVPVALATPGEWEGSRGLYSRAFQIWVSIVVLIATMDGLATQN